MSVPVSFPVLLLVAFGFGAALSFQQAAPPIEGLATVKFPICGTGQRYSCVVDGDTLWIKGEKIRIADIDTPEMNGRCRYERAKAIEARDALAELVSGKPLKLRRSGVDRYGRTLATLHTDEGGVGDALVAQALARKWDGRRRSWC